MEGPHDRHHQAGTADSAVPDASGEALVEDLIEESREFLAASPVPDLTASVMSRIDRLEDGAELRASHGFWVRVRDALLTPRTVSFRLRPVSFLLIPAAIAAFFAVAPFNRSSSDVPGDAIFVQFRLYAPDAASVHLAGTFTGWRPAYSMHETTPGVWTVTLPLPPGVHDYSFVVNDREWVTDPYAPGVDDGFGGTTSRMALLAPDDPRL